jgi:hypothetical protein
MHRTGEEIGIEERVASMAHRLLTSALALMTVSGCVIPIAPKFDDPEPNYPPYLLASDPPPGSILTIQGSPGDPRDISVTIADQNLGDHLFTRWIYDYPPDSDQSRVVLTNEYTPTGDAMRGTLRIQPSCSLHKIAHGLIQHRLMLAVADRDFLNPDDGATVPPEASLDSIPEGGQVLRLVWLINLECK